MVFSSSINFILSFVIVGQKAPKAKWGDEHTNTHTHTHTKYGGLIGLIFSLEEGK
jgi:hypothetical protein